MDGEPDYLAGYATWDEWAEDRILDGGRLAARGAMRHGEAHPQTIASVARYPSVDLSHTRVGDAGLACLRDPLKLEHLNLSGTRDRKSVV